MKKILFILLFFVPFLSFSQNKEKLDQINPIYSEILPIENDRITYSEVNSVEGISKNELFNRANEWIIKTFNSSKDVIQLNDKDAGKIICKTVTDISFGKGWNKVILDPIFYIVTIEVKEGRYKISASNFIHHNVVVLAAVKAESDNPLEDYYKLKSPTKKEIEANIKSAEILSDKINFLFENAKQTMSQLKNDDW